MRIRLIMILLCCGGCAHFPVATVAPKYHNPFPQLQRVAVAPFFNLSTDTTVDGRQVALAYFNELQLVPGFEVVPIGVVEQTAQQFGLSLNTARDARKLAQALEVDALVIGAVTDFTPYYPPRCGLRVEWYAANPCYHPIPAGYGLPIGTPREEEIPEPLIFEAQMAMARAALKPQTPLPPMGSMLLPAPATLAPEEVPAPADDGTGTHGKLLGRIAANNVSANSRGKLSPAGRTVTGGVHLASHGNGGELPAELAAVAAHSFAECDEPVLRHTRTYNGANADFTNRLKTYVCLQRDERFGGWQGYLQRSDDFMRFCCHLHIAEMLTARGGADDSPVVWTHANDR